METLAFIEGASPPRAPRKPRNNWIILSVVASLVILVLVLLSSLIACFLFHYKQSPKKCWIHGSLPVTSKAAIIWSWEENCSGSGISASDSLLEILESDMYFVYIYVARKEDITTENYFTVQLVINSNSNRIVNRLKGIDAARASITLGRPYFLKKGITLHLDFNAGLAHIDSNRTYWGLFKI